MVSTQLSILVLNNMLDLQISKFLPVKGKQMIVLRHRETRICSHPICEPRHEILCFLEES